MYNFLPHTPDGKTPPLYSALFTPIKTALFNENRE